MTECERCHEEHDLTFRLTQVVDESGPIQSLQSVYVVCAGCKTELEDDEDVSW